jgi:hypothetical protein
MKRLFSTIYLFLFLLAWLPQRSLAGRVSFYGADRIGTTSVTAITQTSDGFLWIGTPRGLLRFDGYRFARAPLLSPAGPLPAEITAFCTDSLDRLWVGMDHGLAVFDRASASFTNIVFPDDLKPRVVRLSVGHGGAVLVGTSGFSSFAVDITTLEAVPAHESLPWPDVDFVEAEPVAVPAGLSLDLGDSNVETSSLEGTFETIVGGNTFHAALSLPSMTETVLIGTTDSQVVFVFGNTTYISRKIDGQFPNYKQLLPDTCATTVEIDLPQFSAALKRVSVIALSNPSVRFDIDAEGKVMRLSASSPDQGESTESIPVEVTGDSMSIALNYHYVFDCVNAVSGADELALELQGPMQPAIFKSYGKINYLYLLMPVRM